MNQVSGQHLFRSPRLIGLTFFPKMIGFLSVIKTHPNTIPTFSDMKIRLCQKNSVHDKKPRPQDLHRTGTMNYQHSQTWHKRWTLYSNNCAACTPAHLAFIGERLSENCTSNKSIMRLIKLAYELWHFISTTIFARTSGERNEWEHIASLFFIKKMLVEHVFAQTTANTLQVGDVIFQLLDCFNLLVKEIRLDEILELNKK